MYCICCADCVAARICICPSSTPAAPDPGLVPPAIAGSMPGPIGGTIKAICCGSGANLEVLMEGKAGGIFDGCMLPISGCNFVGSMPLVAWGSFAASTPLIMAAIFDASTGPITGGIFEWSTPTRLAILVGSIMGIVLDGSTPLIIATILAGSIVSSGILDGSMPLII
mmetsp:Transcript_24492/g.56839  ORF Transcript_24492/g.56839 Transcript_24492/m.56839 type:complete len:168 (+) Transcript_24492:669-1172(+)